MAYPTKKVARILLTFNGDPIGIVHGTYSSYFEFGMALYEDLKRTIAW
jgi:hypothetical protein